MQASDQIMKNLQFLNISSDAVKSGAIPMRMKSFLLFILFIFTSLNVSAAANCQEKIAKLLSLPKMASISMTPMPPADEYQDYFISYMTEDKMGTMIARCFNDESKEAFAVPDTNPGANPSIEAPYGTPANAPLEKSAMIGPPFPKEPQIQWRSNN